MASVNGGSHRSIPSLVALSAETHAHQNIQPQTAFPFPSNSVGGNGMANVNGFDRALPSKGQMKRTSPLNNGSMYPFASVGDMGNMFDKWMDNGSTQSASSDSFFNLSSDTLVDDVSPTKGFIGELG